jgi:hypothetical protein
MDRGEIRRELEDRQSLIGYRPLRPCARSLAAFRPFFMLATPRNFGHSQII